MSESVRMNEYDGVVHNFKDDPLFNPPEEAVEAYPSECSNCGARPSAMLIPNDYHERDEDKRDPGLCTQCCHHFETGEKTDEYKECCHKTYLEPRTSDLIYIEGKRLNLTCNSIDEKLRKILKHYIENVGVENDSN